MPGPIWKPRKRTAAERRADALERRAQHYGGADDWPALREAVFRRDRWKCLLCPKTAFAGAALQAAHVKSVGMGGARVGSPSGAEKSDPANIATLCVDCHREVDQGTNRAALRVRLAERLAASIEREQRALTLRYDARTEAITETE